MCSDKYSTSSRGQSSGGSDTSGGSTPTGEDAASGDQLQDAAEEKAESEEQVSETLLSELLKVQEFREFLENPEEIEIPDADKLSLFDLPDTQTLLEGALDRIQASFNVTSVLLELQNLYHILVLVRSNEKTLQDVVLQKDREIHKLKEKKRDPNLIKAVMLADNWRQEKNAERQTTLEYEVAMNNMKAEMKDLEYKINSLQIMNTRLAKDRGKVTKLEDRIRDLEETALKKDRTISQLTDDYSQLEQKTEAIEQREKEKDLMLKAGVDSSKCLQELGLERSRARRREAILFEHKGQIHDLRNTLVDAKRSEQTAVTRFKQIAISIKYLKAQLKKVEESMRESNRRYERLIAIHQKNERKITSLEDRNRQLVNREERLNQLLQSMHHRNETLKEQLSTMTVLEKKYTQRWELIKSLRAKEKEAQDCAKHEHMLSSELKRANIELLESVHHRESQQQKLNRTKEMVMATKQSLAEAIRTNDVLSQRLELGDALIRHYKREMDVCTDQNLDILNVARHLDNICKDHEATIRIKDAKNDSLVLVLQNLKEALKESNANIGKLRQTNLITYSNYKNQMELNDILQELLHFTETEKNVAVHDLNKSMDTVVVLQKQQVMKLTKIAAQYKNISDLKVNINKYLKLLDIQKKETLSVREQLDKAFQREVLMKLRNHALKNERDAFGHMVIQKNTQIQLLEKKVAIFKKLIDRGTTEYRDRVNDIRILKLEIKSLRHTQSAKKATMQANADLRQELISTCRQLRLEQAKRKAIEEMRPPRPHRFFHLKNNDPSEFEKVVKIQKLQKLLIGKFTEVTGMEKTIMARDEQLIQIIQILSRRSVGPCLAEQLYDARTIITQKNKQIKGLLSEVNVLTFDLSHCNKKLEEAIAELNTWKKREMAKNKRETMQYPRLPKRRPLLLIEQTTPAGLISRECCRTCLITKPMTTSNKQATDEMVVRNSEATKSDLTAKYVKGNSKES